MRGVKCMTGRSVRMVGLGGRRWLRVVGAPILLALLLVVMPAPSGAAVTAFASDDAWGPMALATAMARGESANTLVTGSSWVEYPTGAAQAPCVPASNPRAAGVSDDTITAVFGSPDGPSFAVLTSGLATTAAGGGSAASTCDGSVARGANDVVIHRVDLAVPDGHNCLTFTFQFLSEEYPEWVDSPFNDAFLAELDDSTWSVQEETIHAPLNFAYVSPGVPVTINSLGFTFMSDWRAAGTPYGGASERFDANTPITPGAHELYLSIFDASDSILDSAVFVDDLRTSYQEPGHCDPGIDIWEPPEPEYSFVATVSAYGCTSSTLTFKDASKPAKPFVAWAWDFGDGGTGVGDPVQHVFATQGTFDVTMSGSDGTDWFSVTIPVSLTFVACPPEIDPLGYVAVAPGETFTRCATGRAGIGGALSFTMDGMPGGAVRVGDCIEWTPDETHVGYVPCVLVTLHEQGSTLTDSACLAIRVRRPSDPPELDTDRDGIMDSADNCPSTANRDQQDTDGDDAGDACDRVCEGAPACAGAAAAPPSRGPTPPKDGDGDGVVDESDVCPGVADPPQLDADGDRVGDACDVDRDGDAVLDKGALGVLVDNCPGLPNAGQQDGDGDGVGDACQPTAAAAPVHVAPDGVAPPDHAGSSLAGPVAIIVGVAALVAGVVLSAVLRRPRGPGP